MTKVARDTVVFDLGGVLIEWDPRHLYRKLFAGDEAAMEHFLATVCTHEWNRGQDAGRTGLMLEPGRANIHRPLINIRPREMDESDENTEFETDASNVSRLLNRGYLWPAKGDRLFRSLDDRERSVEFS